ncbi:TonB family protein [Sphingomonas sp. BK345]|uniref:TonB family protein n=1 Tax=Sphingomonas sp. BK345 TaxID=2586980 RepID=UPI00161F5130|nr:TonB family protein [Sphingomonas sp. BK345]
MLWIIAAAAAQAPAQPLEPSSRWALDASSAACIAQRSFGEGQVDVSVASPPLEKKVMVTIGLPVLVRAHVGDAVTLVFGPRGERVDGKAIQVAPHGAGKYDFGVETFIANLPKRVFETVGLEVRGKMRVNLHTGSMSAIVQAVERCQRDVLASYGVDPERNKNVTVPALLQDYVNLLAPWNYPPEAKKQRAEGRVAALVHVSAGGRVETCAPVETSGNKALDQGTCVLLVRMGRYTPARDALGVSIASDQVVAVRWTLPE